VNTLVLLPVLSRVASYETPSTI